MKELLNGVVGIAAIAVMLLVVSAVGLVVMSAWPGFAVQLASPDLALAFPSVAAFTSALATGAIAGVMGVCLLIALSALWMIVEATGEFVLELGWHS